ncbi:hypothetical protein KIW84_UN0450 [Lathyrus oleraceus]|nr:hypothetical protein KIW84_UN0450 [Pisum sativum]
MRTRNGVENIGVAQNGVLSEEDARSEVEDETFQPVREIGETSRDRRLKVSTKVNKFKPAFSNSKKFPSKLKDLLDSAVLDGLKFCSFAIWDSHGIAMGWIPPPLKKIHIRFQRDWNLCSYPAWISFLRRDWKLCFHPAWKDTVSPHGSRFFVGIGNCVFISHGRIGFIRMDLVLHREWKLCFHPAWKDRVSPHGSRFFVEIGNCVFFPHGRIEFLRVVS